MENLSKKISIDNCLDINECSGYIFSRIKNYIPWGISIYQKISNDNNPILPSYTFYGVFDKESVKLSYIGVPRFAVSQMKKEIKDKKLYDNLCKLKEFIKNNHFDLKELKSDNEIINKIIKNL